jgi:hypothetical protein
MLSLPSRSLQETNRPPYATFSQASRARVAIASPTITRTPRSATRTGTGPRSRFQSAKVATAIRTAATDAAIRKLRLSGVTCQLVSIKAL